MIFLFFSLNQETNPHTDYLFSQFKTINHFAHLPKYHWKFQKNRCQKKYRSWDRLSGTVASSEVRSMVELLLSSLPRNGFPWPWRPILSRRPGSSRRCALPIAPNDSYGLSFLSVVPPKVSIICCCRPFSVSTAAKIQYGMVALILVHSFLMQLIFKIQSKLTWTPNNIAIKTGLIVLA